MVLEWRWCIGGDCAGMVMVMVLEWLLCWDGDGDGVVVVFE